MRLTVRTGTAGWSIPSVHRDSFAEGDSMLARYATRLDMAEINSSFYRPHQRKTYERWAASVPAAFRFAVKLPRAVTHEQRLRAASLPTDRFVEECTGLGEKLAVVLVQLPPSLAFDGRVAAPFFAMLARSLPAGVHIACEPRHPTWAQPRAEELFERLGINRVGADPPVIAPDGAPSDYGSCRYWRLHGAPRVYYSNYGEEELSALAMRVRALAHGKPAFVVFDNTASGCATANALAFKDMLMATPADRGAGLVGPPGLEPGTKGL
ncbi:DUF72 domain-containing protein [Luteimonas gilva]|uniref:DUF72 domain-containing protein n=1 Tax=Luteimonas gilva TaxID=2572684 RepID=A0A4U5JLE6_9GAMM|nr:DUF72 domain-containing protein [Luteimonas gilva]TKR30460.1 DUF72 domain-containing protein [Luteimonas gilva]